MHRTARSGTSHPVSLDQVSSPLVLARRQSIVLAGLFTASPQVGDRHLTESGRPAGMSGSTAACRLPHLADGRVTAVRCSATFIR